MMLIILAFSYAKKKREKDVLISLLFCVFQDGHGGKDVANHAADFMHALLYDKLKVI